MSKDGYKMMVTDEFDAVEFDAVLIAYEPHPGGIYAALECDEDRVNVNLHPDDIRRLAKAADKVVELGAKLADVPREDRVRITHAGLGLLSRESGLGEEFGGGKPFHPEAMLISGIMLSFQPRAAAKYSQRGKQEMIKALTQAIDNLKESLEVR